MMEENSDIFLAGGDPSCKHMYAFRVIVTAVGLFQKILLNTIAHMY